jgi:hypothetical protein
VTGSNASVIQASTTLLSGVSLSSNVNTTFSSSSTIASQVSLLSSYENIVSRGATFDINVLLSVIARAIVPSSASFSVGVSLNSSTALSLYSLVFTTSGHILRVPLGQEAGRPYLTLTPTGILTRGTSGVRVVTDAAGNLYRV